MRIALTVNGRPVQADVTPRTHLADFLREHLLLTGPLAQIGRSGIVRDLVRRIGAAFAQNLDAQLRDPTANLPATSLGGLSLITRVLADRLRTLLARLLGR